jgi:signal transduction histidine kinase
VPPASIQSEDQWQHAIDRLLEVVKDDCNAVEDISVLRQALAQLRDANENLVLATVKAQVLQEEADMRNRRQNEFLAMLAHELRNPMAPISNAAQLLQEITSAHPLLPGIQQVLDRQIGHAARLLDDLLDASRISSGKVTLLRSVVSLDAILAQALEVSRPFIEQRHQHLEVESPGAPVYIDGDLVRLSQVFSNILINASKYSPDNGCITISARLLFDSVAVTVSDNGRGIDPSLLPYIFDLFVQGDRSLDRADGGLGIGLSVAKGITEMHGGRITARSDGLGHGSCFEVMLPLANPVASAAASGRRTTGTAGADKYRILVVEDNEDFGSTLATILELQGHSVEIANNGLSALALAKEQAFDVILCDIGIPRLNGYDLIAQVRLHGGHPRPYAIAISGYGQPEDRQRALEAGFDDYLVKPFHNANLLHLLASR